MPRRERDFQAHLIKQLRLLVEPFGVVLKLDTSYLQGLPDLLILYKNRWAVLECKRSANEPYQPNQEYYLEALNNLSFAACIHPENEEEVISELQQALRIR